MSSISDLIASRKAWIEETLRPWCAQAAQRDLRLAEELWPDIAGKVDPEKTLWCWAWSRFPALVNLELQGIDETNEVTVILKDGSSFTGYPDGRKSKQGQLLLLGRNPEDGRSSEFGPFAIDEVSAIAANS